MVYTNEQLYNIALGLRDNILFNKDIVFPAKVSFYLLKNNNILQPLIEEIENIRMKVAQAYGEFDSETGNYNVLPEYMQQAETELRDLFNATQEADFYTITFEDLKETQLTVPQTQALMFMIEE